RVCTSRICVCNMDSINIENFITMLSCNRMDKSLQLPLDVLFEIFRHANFDRKTLYSCFLVNREWCRTAVSFLWRDPFGLILTTTDSRHNVTSHISEDILDLDSEKLYDFFQIWLSGLSRKAFGTLA